MLAAIQERLAVEVQVVLGTKERRRFRTEDYFYYYRHLKQAFLEQQHKFSPEEPPDIPGLKNLGRWSGHAAKILEEHDDLSLIANIRSTQIRRLREAGIDTVPVPLGDRVRRIAPRRARGVCSTPGAGLPPGSIQRPGQAEV